VFEMKRRSCGPDQTGTNSNSHADNELLSQQLLQNQQSHQLMQSQRLTSSGLTAAAQFGLRKFSQQVSNNNMQNKLSSS
jgi:hypothetical protein